ncbi:acyl carrier protein [Mycobacterium intracellulare]|uniref:acyl carrier protein n=1 Tax=Mycobacterium intracellulare TaxID=1767 RepID=UPI001EEEA801|nr:acyl carrier protein [Mycobacterium intracellulare]MEE3755343.1 acyl carrier protein [Mycobacterium intracellulare]
MTDGDAVSRARIESEIVELVGRALGDVERGGLERQVEFRSLGLDSQSIIALIATVERQFGIQFGLDTPPEAFASIAQLSDEVFNLRTALDISS